MPRNAEEVANRIREITHAGFRGKLIARGLARGMIWRDGKLPPDAPPFSHELSTDLLDHGFNVLALALELRELDGDAAVVKQGLHTAAEAIESAVRRGEEDDLERGFHLMVSAAAFHIGGYAARAFSLFEGDLAGLNLASYEQALVHLMRRNFVQLRANTAAWLQAEENSDRGVVSRLTNEEGFSVDDVAAIALTRIFHRAIAVFEVALLTGRVQYIETARDRLQQGLTEAAAASHVPLWWAFRLARHLFDDLWHNSLHVLLPSEGGPPSWPQLRSYFLQLLAARPVAEVDLWPSQVEAARRVLDTKDDLVVALPTSAGKTRIAELSILRALADGKRVVYVTPLRALSAQIEITLARTFRPLGYSVTSVYGASGVAASDIETLKSAAIVVATPEKVDFAIRQDSTVIDDVGLIVLDEGHMIGLNERDIRYEMLLQRLLRRDDASDRRLVCLSAVFTKGEAFDDFTAWLRSDEPGTAIQSTWRPTRQRPGTIEWQTNVARLELDVEGEKPFVPKFIEARDPIPPRKTRKFPADAQELVVASSDQFLSRGQSVLIYCPLKISVESTAKAFLAAHEGGYFEPAIDQSALPHLADALRVGKEWLGETHPAVACLPLGIAVHHGSLPRSFLGEIESLLKRRILPVCISSPTLAQGVDLCFSVLLFRSLYHSGKLIKAKDFANIVGRVGRAFVDLDGIYLLPIFEKEAAKSRTRKREFQSLVTAARQRQLESGVRLLIDVIIHIFSDRLGVSKDDVITYVTNMQSTWTVEKKDEKDEWPGILQACLNELDTAILGVVDALDLPLSKLAAYLDSCMQSSYWQRQLQRSDANLKRLQESVMQNRAAWLWTHTDVKKRRGFFAAGVGYAAGKALDDNAAKLKVLLEAAEKGINSNDIESAVKAVIELAKILFTIGPFEPQELTKELTDTWPDLLADWLRGRGLGEFADNDGVSFIQSDVIFRLVWAVEAARLHIRQLEEEQDDEPGNLAICLTYGVPNRGAGLLMQAGMSSRTLACKCARIAGDDFTDLAGLKIWVESILKGERAHPTLKSEHDREEWSRFLHRFEHREHSKWRLIELVLPVDWHAAPPKPNTRVRVAVNQDKSATIYSVSMNEVGAAKVPGGISTSHFFGVVRDDSKLDVSFFGI